LISVIIPTRNRAQYLKNALKSITNQTLNPNEFEVIVIDNGSTDSTCKVASKFKIKIPNLKYFFAPEPGLHVGRHLGLKESSGDILVFADDDIEAFPSWLESYNSIFNSSKSIAMAGGNNIPKFECEPPNWINELWKKSLFKSYNSIPLLSVIEFKKNPKFISPFLVWGCNFAIRKDVLLAAGGFHPDGMPNELLQYRGDGETHVSRYVEESRLLCAFSKEASVFHLVTKSRMSSEYFRNRGFSQGISDSFSSKRVVSKKKIMTVKFFKRAINFFVTKLTYFFYSKDVKFIINTVQKGYTEGYSFHDKAYKNDANVYKWVHKKFFFE
jgi:glucosyl-dolichyl phosphate glucuronosyltransferase